MTPEVGSEAPDFELPDSTGAVRTLGGLAAGGALVLIVYRGHW